MNTILTINLTGSVFLVFYFLVKCFLKERLSKKYFYRLLQVNVICFLVPLMVLGELYRGFWWDLKILLIDNWNCNVQVTPRTPMVLQIEQKINLSIGMKGRMILLGSYLSMVLLCFIIEIVRDCMKKRPIQRAIRISGVSQPPDLLELKREMGIRKKVDLCLCREASQIATIGLFHPIIFFKDPGDPAAREMILGHELYHIKGRDVLWRWIAILMNCIHFYNPLAYVLRQEMEKMQELQCDERVVSGLDERGRGKYADLLIQNSKEETGRLRFSTFFGGLGSYRKLRERIKWIMKKDLKKKLSKRVAAALTAVVLGATSLTALAYDEMSWWVGDGKRSESWNEDDAEGITAARAFAYMEGLEKSSIEEDPILYEKEYIDAEGNVHPLNSENSPMAFCIFHKYENFKVVEHYLLTTGGCEVWYYDAVMCVKCHYTKNRELTRVTEFPVCPHDLD